MTRCVVVFVVAVVASAAWSIIVVVVVVVIARLAVAVVSTSAARRPLLRSFRSFLCFLCLFRRFLGEFLGATLLAELRQRHRAAFVCAQLVVVGDERCALFHAHLLYTCAL